MVKRGIGQTRNPRTCKYVKIDMDKGKILGTKKTPFKNVLVITKRVDEHKK